MALRVLGAVLREGVALEVALARHGKDLSARDRGLAHAIVAGCLRWLPDLDSLIDGATRLRLADDAKARLALRIALAQAVLLGTPGHAAIATVLPLVDGGPRRLVHGVFGTLMRNRAALPDRPHLPAAVAERWRAAWGEVMVGAAEAAIAVPPPLDLSLKPGSRGPDGVALAPHHARLPAGADVPTLPGYDAGDWWVQDLAASIPARLIGAGKGHAIDLCAAPGGKTLQLAAAGWHVTAVDSSTSRLARLSDNLERTGLEAAIVEDDVMRWAPEAPADAILLDAPCSATGIFRRHPDVLYRARPIVIAELAELQAAMLARAAQWVRPGGRLVYAVCSLELAEGEDQIARFLHAHGGWRLDPVTPDELPAGIAPSERGWVRTLPTMLAEAGRLDGFFVARFSRAA